METSTVSEIVNEFAKSGFENLASDATFSDRLIYGLKICGIGMLIVFGVLALICGILYLFKLFAVVSKNKPTTKTNTQVANASVNETSEETVVAVATAAIAALRNESDAAFKIISITKIN